jgi:hypothetical protein
LALYRELIIFRNLAYGLEKRTWVAMEMQHKEGLTIPAEQSALFRDLCEVIVQRTLACCAIRNDGVAFGYHHNSMSIWEDAFGLLRTIGVLRSAANGPHQLCLPLKKLANHVQQLELRDPEGFDFALATFIGACYEDDLPCTRHQFEMPPKYRHIADVLKENGYLTCNADLWQWTDRILPAMAANYLWSSEGECFDDTERAEISAIAERILTHLPLHLRATLSDYGKRELSVELLFRGVEESGWISRWTVGDWLDKTRDPELAEMKFPIRRLPQILAQLVRKMKLS